MSTRADFEFLASSISEAMRISRESADRRSEQLIGSLVGSLGVVATAIHTAAGTTLKVSKEKLDEVYAERNMVVALAAWLVAQVPNDGDGMCPQVWLVEDPAMINPADYEWRWVVFIQIPTGQLSWHIHERELPLFADVPRVNDRAKFDGHTTEQKYERIKKLVDNPVF